MCYNAITPPSIMQFSIIVLALTSFVIVESCSDSGSNCANWKNNGFCTSSFYTTAQKYAYCASTCGLCSSTSSTSTSSSSTTSSSCSDSGSACSSWKANGYCSSSFYTTAQKKAYCAKSCSLC